VRLATIDPLRVELVVPAQLFGSIRTGAWLKVLPELPNVSPRPAKVVLVDPMIDGPSNTFRARLELPNAKYEVPAGLRCKVDLGLDSGASTAEQTIGKPVPELRPERNVPQVKPVGGR
jgi:multidrug efflux pump subunit AcrA (membrane-fusion protein)